MFLQAPHISAQAREMAAHLLDVDCDDDEPARAAAPAAAAAGGAAAAGPPAVAGPPPSTVPPGVADPAAAAASAASAGGAGAPRWAGDGAAQAPEQPPTLRAAISLGAAERAEADAMPWHELVGHSAFAGTPCSLPPLFASGAALPSLAASSGLGA